MFEIHQSGPALCSSRSDDSALSMCEEKRLDTTVSQKKEASTDKKGNSPTKIKSGSSRQGHKRDPNLDHPAVRKYRDIVHLQANHIQRQDIALTVENSERGLRIWEAVLLEYMGAGYPPKRVDWMLRNYQKMMPNGNGQNL